MSDQFVQGSLANFISNNIEGLLIIFLIWLALWLLIREVKTWYWKINKIVSLLEKIDTNIDYVANYLYNEGKAKKNN